MEAADNSKNEKKALVLYSFTLMDRNIVLFIGLFVRNLTTSLNPTPNVILSRMRISFLLL